MKLNIEIFGDKKVIGSFEKSALFSGNLQPAMEDAALYIMGETADRFDAGGIPKWKKLSEEHRFFKIAHNYDPRILHMHAGLPLKSSVTRWKARGQILIVTKDGLRFGTTIPYAKMHQFGWPPGNVPKRRFLFTTVKDRKNIASIVGQRLMEPFEMWETGVPAFGGGFMIRGAKGRFVGATKRR